MSHSIKSLGFTLDCHLPMNNTARLVLRVPQTDHISLHHVSLHWLPTKSRIQQKLTSLCYNCPNSAIHVYSIELLNVYTPVRQLRSSSDTSTLCLLSVCTHSLGQRSFRMLHRLSGTVSLATLYHQTLTSFKSSFKSHIFKLSY